jgi:hypothetical protein
MCHCYGLPSSKSRFFCGTTHLSGCGIGSEGGSVGLFHRNFTTHPGMGLFNRSAWTIIIGLYLFEEVQYVLRTISRPNCEKVMIRVL